ncbi:MAG TPA: hypothetical protein VHR45_09785 [Thermoanaerobaculia bacterium]|nr:hypothetical protein [Thermoanaerobaculia bacterium]
MLAVRVALQDTLSETLTTYNLADNCIPLSALFRILVVAGVRLSEMLLRMPSLASGALLVALVPWAVARRLGRRPALVLAWLLALSPPLVFYSRIARSYMPAILLASGAVIAFEAWWRRPSMRTGAGYLTLAVLAAWFHLLAAPLVLAPFLFAAGNLFVGRERRRRALVLLTLAAATLAGLLAFILPARTSLWQLIQAKHQAATTIPGPEIACVLELEAGNGHRAAAMLFWGAAAAGLVLLFLQTRRLAAYTLTVSAAFVVAVFLLAPHGYEYPVVLNRYLLLGLPIVLLWVAVALAGAGQVAGAMHRSRLLWVAIPVLTLAFLGLTGPLANPRLWRSPFMHEEPYLQYCSAAPVQTTSEVPDFYRLLGQSPAPAPVLEYPWMPLWRLNRAFLFYQQVHRQDVVVSMPRPPLWDKRLAFRNMVEPYPESILASRARYLVVHRDLSKEELRLPQMPLAQRGDDLAAKVEYEMHSHAVNLAHHLKRLWGPPDYADEVLQVWDLARIRTETAASGRASSGPPRRSQRAGTNRIASGVDSPVLEQGAQPLAP